MKTEINDNTITLNGFSASGITVDTEGAGSTTMHATINGNNISAVTGSSVFGGVELLSRNSHTLCANVNTNSVNVTGGITHEFVVSESLGGTVHLQGFMANAATTWSNNGNTTTTSTSETGAASAPAGACQTPGHATP